MNTIPIHVSWGIKGMLYNHLKKLKRRKMKKVELDKNATFEKFVNLSIEIGKMNTVMQSIQGIPMWIQFFEDIYNAGYAEGVKANVSEKVNQIIKNN
jgi:hypothetical protein